MSAVKPTPDVPYPELAACLPQLRARLEEQREFRIEQLVDLAAAEAAAGKPDTGDGEHPGGTPEEQARGEIPALLAAGARRALADIEGALDRIAAGRYGRCLCCGQPIEPARLIAVPQTPLCGACQGGAAPRSRVGRPGLARPRHRGGSAT
jgi:DnaK suppressor protein